MSKKILYVVDMQRDFMPFEGSALPVPGGDAAIAPINARLEALDPKEYEFVVFSEDFHAPDFVEHMPDGTPFAAHCVAGTEGAKTIVDLSLVPANIPVMLIRKNAFDVWEEDTLPVFDFRTGQKMDLERNELFSSAQDMDVVDVVLTGVCSDICVSQAGKGLLDRGFNVTVPRNCVKGLFREIEQVNAEDWGGRANLI